jgi:RNA polymerase-binding protein DksA
VADAKKAKKNKGSKTRRANVKAAKPVKKTSRKPTVAATVVKKVRPAKNSASQAEASGGTQSPRLAQPSKLNQSTVRKVKPIVVKPGLLTLKKTTAPAAPVKESTKVFKSAPPEPVGLKRALEKPAEDVEVTSLTNTVLPTDEELKKVKTGLTKKDLGYFRELLWKKRAEIIGDVTAMEIDARLQNSGGNLSNMPMHMADVGSDNYEQEFTLGLVESERKLLLEIEAALFRIKNQTYGVCLERCVPISRVRLEAKPWAKYCIEVARERERRGEST